MRLPSARASYPLCGGFPSWCCAQSGYARALACLPPCAPL
jgi:hypothetical protein